jgi:thioredoxin 1
MKAVHSYIRGIELQAIRELIDKSVRLTPLFLICMLLMLQNPVNGSESLDNKSLTGIEAIRESPFFPLIINDSNLDSTLKHYKNVVLECWKYDCVPCELISPTINEMANDMRGKVVFGKLSIAENPITVGKYDVTRGPTLLIFNKGTLIYKHVGNYPKQTLEDMIIDKLRLS